MKRNFLPVITIILFVFILSCSEDSKAQCDNPYYTFKEGARFVSETYDDNDKLQGKSEGLFKKVEPIEGGYKAVIFYKVYDKKGKDINEGEYEMICENGIVKMDLSRFVPDESMEAFKDMEVQIEMGSMEIPSSLSAGQSLPDAQLKISAQGGPIPMNMIFLMTNRKVEGKEKVTTPAGTFDCYKLSYDMNMNFMMGQSTIKNVQFLAEKYGAVRTESYRSNGKLISYTIITQYEM